MRLFRRRDKAGAPAVPASPAAPAAADPVLETPPENEPIVLSAAGFARLRDSVVVYSNFRAGSHLLQSCLSSLTALRDVDEVFARRNDDPLGFNAFLDTDEADLRGLLLAPERTLPGYFRFLFDRLDHDAPLIFSLKYTQAHRLGADDMTAVPLLLKLLAAYRVPVLHLVRRDVVQQAISHLVATETGQFHGTVTTATGGQPAIWLDPAEVLALARARAEEQRRARAHLAAVSARHLTVYYEELTPGRLPQELRRTFRFLDRYANVPDGYRPRTTQMESDRHVVNRAEIHDHLLERAPDLVSALGA